MSANTLPPLFLNSSGYLPVHPPPPIPRPTSYTLPNGGGERLSFPTGLFECFSIQDTGFDCFFAHCCCGPCIYDSAMRYAGIEGSTFAATADIVSGALSSTRGNGAAKSAAGAAAVYSKARVRQNLVAKFYPEGMSEGFTLSLFYHCCCSRCAWAQEVNAIMVWAEETKGKQLYYGSVQSCNCAHLTDDSGRLVYKASAESAPTTGVMDR
jgi:hypothetical protein